MQERVQFQADRCQHQFDVCVIGGGMAGICAAIASARNGARTALVHDRSVLGGNASSEIRMWICGAHGRNNKETGILEEIQLANCHRNPSGNYAIWDSVLYEHVQFQPNLELFLNCSCTDAVSEETGDGRRVIHSIQAWQTTSQLWHEIAAELFIDCSGDSILAATCGARFRTGRESRDEFNEDISPSVGDDKTMGNSILIQLRKTDSPQPFQAPSWAYRFAGPEDLPHRINGVNGANFWWIELGGLNDTIRDAEAIRHDLYCTAFGVWDYIKNRALEREQAENWALEWVGSLPGKRENRRYVAPHIMTQHDVRGGDFDDVVAYGGWTMDDHHPAGLLYPGAPTIFHPAPSPYGIPFRCLHSANVDNLLFAGRNISVTHAALSSTRVMATCAVIGQAVGTAAALCHRHGCQPGSMSQHMAELQQTLMEDDAWLPGCQRAVTEMTKTAAVSGPGEPESLRDGHDRDIGDVGHAWEAAVGQAVFWEWDAPQTIDSLRFVLDSDLQNNKRMPCRYPLPGNRSAMPRSLLRGFRIEVETSAGWETAYQVDGNTQRLVYAPVGRETKRLRVVPDATWGSADARIFSIDICAEPGDKRPSPPPTVSFQELVQRCAPEDLADPEPTADAAVPRRGHSA